MQETEAQKKHLLPGLGLGSGGGGRQGSDEGHRPFLPLTSSDAQALPRPMRGAGGGMEGAAASPSAPNASRCPASHHSWSQQLAHGLQGPERQCPFASPGFWHVLWD